MSNEKPFKVTIAWGGEKQIESKYSFATEAELTAFLYGVDESSGWMDYEILDEETEGCLM